MRAARAFAVASVATAALAAVASTRARAAESKPATAVAATTPLAVPAALLAAQPEPVARALRANVLLERDEGADRAPTVAAGVILRLRDGTATIVTAQHAVDPRFTGRVPAKAGTLPGITVTSIGGVHAHATIEWLAPHGVDLAIVSARLPDAEARAAARADDAPLPEPGAPVFTVGNPPGAGWTRVNGTVKQQRDARQDGFAFTMLWSDLVVQPGFSGGGLYDVQGRLVAIDSTRGAISTGLRGRALLLSTALRALVDLAPAALQSGD